MKISELLGMGKTIAMFSKPGFYIFTADMKPVKGPHSLEDADTFLLKNQTKDFDQHFVKSEQEFRKMAGLK